MARYLARPVDPDTGVPLGDETWTDYLGGPYGDFNVVFDPDTAGPTTVTEEWMYLSGAGQMAAGDPNDVSYYHGDLVGSTVATSGAAGAKRATLAYTAFGEPVGSVPGDYPRYQYAGGYDYESGLLTLNGAAWTAPIRLQHVGYRWYQPGIGRFVQRDPIGIEGGMNAYAYTGNDRVDAVDPTGLEGIRQRIGRIDRLLKKIQDAYFKTWSPARQAQLLRKHRKLVRAKNTLYGRLYGQGPLPSVVLAACLLEFHYEVIDPAVLAARDWERRHRSAFRRANRMRINRMGGFGPGEGNGLWGLD